MFLRRSAAIGELREPDDLSRLAEHLMREAEATAARDAGVLLDVASGGLRCVIVRAEPHAAAPTPAPALSPRESEIARMVAQGHPNKVIAAVLDISAWTVNTYLRRMFVKLGVTSRAAMVARLLR
jgi:DNA-binding CsgD family transcriptional regulator